MMFPHDTHAENAPQTWIVTKAGRSSWNLQTKDGDTLGTFTTRHEAERHALEGFYVKLYNDEKTWYAGGEVAGWKPYCNDKVTS